jgi:hypothetical protein
MTALNAGNLTVGDLSFSYQEEGKIGTFNIPTKIEKPLVPKQKGQMIALFNDILKCRADRSVATEMYQKVHWSIKVTAERKDESGFVVSWRLE